MHEYLNQLTVWPEILGLVVGGLMGLRLAGRNIDKFKNMADPAKPDVNHDPASLVEMRKAWAKVLSCAGVGVFVGAAAEIISKIPTDKLF